MRTGLCLVLLLILAARNVQAAQDDLPPCTGQGAPQRGFGA